MPEVQLVPCRRWLPALLFASVLAPAPVRADETSRAREAFQEGLTMESASDFGAALGKFREVAAVKKTPPVLFHVAFCQERLGQLADALAGYEDAATLAGAAGDADPKLLEVRRTIDLARRALDARVPRLTLKRGEGARLANVWLDRAKLSTADVGKPLRLDPGEHTIEARASGKERFRKKLALAEKQQVEVELTLRDWEGAEPSESPEAAPRIDTPSAAPGPHGSVAPFVILGAGAAALGASGVFFLLRTGAVKDMGTQCAGTVCPTSAQATGDRARSWNTWTNATLAVGGVGVVAAAVWLLARGAADPGTPPSARAPRVWVGASPAPLGASLAGAF